MSQLIIAEWLHKAFSCVSEGWIFTLRKHFWAPSSGEIGLASNKYSTTAMPMHANLIGFSMLSKQIHSTASWVGLKNTFAYIFVTHEDAFMACFWTFYLLFVIKNWSFIFSAWIKSMMSSHCVIYAQLSFNFSLLSNWIERRKVQTAQSSSISRFLFKSLNFMQIFLSIFEIFVYSDLFPSQKSLVYRQNIFSIFLLPFSMSSNFSCTWIFIKYCSKEEKSRQSNFSVSFSFVCTFIHIRDAPMAR